MAWSYGGKVSAYNPGTDSWRGLQPVPVGECEGGPSDLLAVGEMLYGEYCGVLLTYDSAAGAWSKIEHPKLSISTTAPFVAGRSVLIPAYGARYGPTHPTFLFAYRPR